MSKVRLDVCMEKTMKDKIRSIVRKGVKYRDLSHFVIVACDGLIQSEEETQNGRCRE